MTKFTFLFTLNNVKCAFLFTLQQEKYTFSCNNDVFCVSLPKKRILTNVFLHIFDLCYNVNILNFVISHFNIGRLRKEYKQYPLR